MLEINLQEYYDNYKDIVDTCNKNGLILPYTLQFIYVPKEYQPIKGEIAKITKKNLAKRKIAHFNRRLEDKELIRKYDWSKKKERENYEKARNLKNDKELKEFLEKFPKFKKIIKE